MSGNQTRRSVLKLTGATVATATTTQVVSADGVHKGISYYTLTQKPVGVVSGDIEKTSSGEIGGSIQIAGFNLSLENLKERDSPDAYSAKYTETKYTKGGDPIVLNLYEENLDSHHHYAGTMTRPSPDYGELGFYLTANPDFSPATALANRKPDQKWTERFDFSIPSEGIPTDTSIASVRDKMANEKDNRGGN